MFKRNFLSPFQIKLFNPYAVIFGSLLSQLLLIMSEVTRLVEKFCQAGRSPKPSKSKKENITK